MKTLYYLTAVLEGNYSKERITYSADIWAEDIETATSILEERIDTYSFRILKIEHIGTRYS